MCGGGWISDLVNQVTKPVESLVNTVGDIGQGAINAVGDAGQSVINTAQDNPGLTAALLAAATGGFGAAALPEASALDAAGADMVTGGMAGVAPTAAAAAAPTLSDVVSSPVTQGAVQETTLPGLADIATPTSVAPTTPVLDAATNFTSDLPAGYTPYQAPAVSDLAQIANADATAALPAAAPELTAQQTLEQIANEQASSATASAESSTLSPSLQKVLNSTLTGGLASGAVAALLGGNVGQSALSGAVGSGVNSGINSLLNSTPTSTANTGSAGGTMTPDQTQAAVNAYIDAGSSPEQAAQYVATATGSNLDAVNNATINNTGTIQVADQTPYSLATANSTPTTAAAGAANAGTAGAGTTANQFPWMQGLLGLYDMYNKQNASKALQDQFDKVNTQINGMYAPGSPEANLMQQEMERKDAAAGRNSQYGVRATDLAAKLAATKGQLLSNTLGNQNNLLAASLATGNSSLGSLANLFGQTTGSTAANTVGNAAGTAVNSAIGSGVNSAIDWGKTTLSDLFGSLGG